MSEKSFDELCEEISAQVGSPTLLVGDKLKPVLNQHFFARFVAAKYNPIYEISEEMFYIYSTETGLWEPQDRPSMTDLISTTMMLFAQEKGDSIVNAKRGVVVIRQILEFMKAKNCCGRTNAFARKGEPFIHCKNGVITFPKQEDGCRKPVLKPFDPKYMSRNRTEIEYHEAAVCNEFKTRLLEPALSEDDIAHLQLYFGQCLLGINSSQTFLLMIGTPGGGKSTFVNVVEKAVNRQNCTELRLRHLADSRFETQRLLGKTLLTAKDVPSNFFSTSGASTLKAITGNDTVTGELKGSNTVTDICGEFNAIVTSNNTLRIPLDGDAGAWARRIILINYNNPPPKEKILHLDDYLLENEGAGILKWGVEGAMLLLENDGQITKSKEQKNKVRNLLQQSDPITEYLEVRLCVGGKKDTVSVSELLEDFRKFIMKKGWPPISCKYLTGSLPEYIFDMFGCTRRNDVVRNGTRVRGYYGLKFNS